MAGNLERGGQHLGRWPAEADADQPEGHVDDDTGAFQELGSDEQDRLSQLPAHEVDTDTSIGGGMTGAGAVAEDRGSWGSGIDQPLPQEEGLGLGSGGALGDEGLGGERTEDDSGLPLGGR